MTPKQRRFTAEYLKDQNGTQAAIRAGYSRKTANEQASRLLAKVSIRSAIDSAIKRIAEKSELTAQIVHKKVLAMLTFDPCKAFNFDGTMKDVNQMSDDILIAITSIEVNGRRGEVRKIRFTDRIRAAELAAKILGMLRLGVVVKDGGPLAVPVAQIDFSRIDDDMLKKVAGMARCTASCCSLEKSGRSPPLLRKTRQIT